LQAVHEHGGYGSAGYGYCWKRSEAQKNLLRTHTTAVSSRMLYKLAQEGFKYDHTTPDLTLFLCLHHHHLVAALRIINTSPAPPARHIYSLHSLL
jgi:hypothetical protein